MSAQVIKIECFRALVEHHIGMIGRFKEDKFFSILFLYTQNLSEDFIRNAAQKVARRSDVVSSTKDAFLLFMPQTSREGAELVSKELMLFCGKELESEIVVYGEDGEEYDKLISKIRDNVNFWHNLNIEI